MMKILIFQKHPSETIHFRRTVQFIVKRLQLQCIIDTYMTLQNLLQRLEQNIFEYDIVVLNGDSAESYQLASFLRKTNHRCSLILLSDDKKTILNYMFYRLSLYISDQTQVKGYYRYLERIIVSGLNRTQYFTIETKDEMVQIPFASIEYIESSGRYVYVHVNQTKKVYRMTAKLDDLITKLPDAMFVRCHQSNLVNLKYIIGVDKKMKLFLSQSGRQIAISRRYYTTVMKVYQNYIKRDKNAISYK